MRLSKREQALYLNGNPPPDDGPLIARAEVERLANIRRRRIDELMAKGEFPRPAKGGRERRWRKAEVEAWIEAQGG